MGKDGGYLPPLLSLSESDIIKNHFLYIHINKTLPFLLPVAPPFTLFSLLGLLAIDQTEAESYNETGTGSLASLLDLRLPHKQHLVILSFVAANVCA